MQEDFWYGLPLAQTSSLLLTRVMPWVYCSICREQEILEISHLTPSQWPLSVLVLSGLQHATSSKYWVKECPWQQESLKLLTTSSRVCQWQHKEGMLQLSWGVPTHFYSFAYFSIFNFNFSILVGERAKQAKTLSGLNNENQRYMLFVCI